MLAANKPWVTGQRKSLQSNLESFSAAPLASFYFASEQGAALEVEHVIAPWKTLFDNIEWIHIKNPLLRGY